MLFKIILGLSFVAGSIIAQDEKPSPTTTSIVYTKPGPPTTTIVYTKPGPPTTTIVYTKPGPPTTPDPTNSTPRFPTQTPLPPITQQIYPLCYSGPNEIYLPRRIAPYCQVNCMDLGKECLMRLDIMEPSGCYCKPGYCRNEKGECVPFSEYFTECHINE